MILKRVAVWIFRLFSSLRFAVVVIAGIALSLAAGTILESYYDTRTASYYVYRSAWFYALLTALGLNILCVALSRWPWKRIHIPFLLAHAGILILLTGSWITRHTGVDGIMRITEGDTVGSVDFEEEILALSDGAKVRLINVPWIPPGAQFRTLNLPEYGLKIDRYITHAEAFVAFRPPEAGDSADSAAPAVKLKLQGGPMRITQEFWLWQGDPGWSFASMGPARFVLLPKDSGGFSKENSPGEALLELKTAPDGSVEYQAISRRKEVKQGRIAADKVEGAVIDPGWMGVTVSLSQWVPKALNKTSYTSAKIQYGDQAPPSAVRLSTGAGSEVWLGLGDQTSLEVAGHEIKVVYTTRRVILPFALHLDRFQIDHDAGTNSPSSFWSRVSVLGENAPRSPQVISMNEPLVFGGYTFYQSSYVPEAPRPVTSVFSVNHDPGRPWKYLGSLLIVAGAVLLFASRRLKSTGGNR